MAKQLKIKYMDQEYTLEYTRKTVLEMENRGFVAADAEAKPMTVLPALFAGAFLAHHRRTKQNVIDNIYNMLTDKEGLIEKLAEMYAEPIETLVSEPEDEAAKLDWTANF